ncbi:MAG TPA: hypothetical protein VFX50_18390, partial [Gemmatimonadales bacterium]|nr:hypothetical protein [Gemmatimonadales bacterium]
MLIVGTPRPAKAQDRHTVSCSAHRVGTRTSHALAFDGASGRVVMFGGLSGDSTNRQPRSLWAWEGDRWVCVHADGPPGRSDALLAYDEARGRLVLFGGRVYTSARQFRFLLDTWEWDGARWTLADSLGPGPRIHGAVAYDPVRRAVVLQGGGGESSMLSDAWEWTGSRWRAVTLPIPDDAIGNALFGTTNGLVLMIAARDSSPECAQARRRAVALGERAGSLIPLGGTGPCLSPMAPAAQTSSGFLLYTGWNPGEPAATWTWRDGRWLRADTAPPRRRGAHAAWDASRRRVILFGGNDDSGILGDTWEWDGERWT